MIYGADTLTEFGKSSLLEWLETNGLGSYASGSVSGALTRRYHGLLIAALQPPVKRTVLLSKLDETIVLDNAMSGDTIRYDLSVNQYPGTLHPEGFLHLESFERTAFPVFYYAVAGIRLKKTIAMLLEKNTTLVLYEVEDAPADFSFQLLPLASARDHHGISRENASIGSQYLFDDGVFRTVNYHGGAELFINVPGSTFVASQNWYKNFEYLRELERGLEFREDLYTHGHFAVTLRKGARLGVIISTDNPQGLDAFALFAEESQRRQWVMQQSPDESPFVPRLMLAADQFIARRGKRYTAIAGYPWFSDWGRDTMISLPGLCLATGRLPIAREILLEYTQFVSEGMLPNRFPDQGQEPEYNTFDATLWFFHAVYQYFLASHDRDLIQLLLPTLSHIVEHHINGTRFGIGVDPRDHLLRGGKAGVQLTWMDAKVGEWVVTPRIGKPVEINALWYNALRIMEALHNEFLQSDEADAYGHRAETLRVSFEATFWNTTENCLFDYTDDNASHGEIRPNQIYAVSLTFPVIDGERAAAIVDVVRQKLVTPFGLRSLAPGSPGYMGKCSGSVLERDGAYHQGTVWTYLIGAYIDALYAVHASAARQEASELVQSCCSQLDVACVGSISEIFDGDWPHAPKGCIAQAWSVAELLRIVKRYHL